MAEHSNPSTSSRKRKSTTKSTKKNKTSRTYNDSDSLSNLITAFDKCKLKHVSEQQKDCHICATVKQKKVITRYICDACKVCCCVQCYDYHHREKFKESLSNFQSSCPENSSVYIDDEGKYYVAPDDAPEEKSESLPKTKTNSSKFDFKTLKKHVFETFDAIFHYNEKLKCAYLQDKQMKEFFHYHPEFISIHVVCEVMEPGITVYISIAEDANGHCEIFAVLFIFGEESKENLKWFCELLKKQNEKWKKTSILCLDKRIHCVDMIKGEFPEAKVVISAFHAVQAFKMDMLNSDIETEMMKVAIKLFHNILSSSNDQEYEKQLAELFNTLPSLTTYFNDVWQCDKPSWTLALNYKSKVFLTPMNSFLNYIEKKIKTSLNTKDSLENIINALFKCVVNLRKKHFKKVSAVYQSAKVTQLRMPQSKYAKLLTCYAGNLVCEQFQLLSQMRKINRVSSGNYKIENSLLVTIYNCSCSFNQLLTLPCCHMLAIRKMLSLPLFAPTLCGNRWLSQTYCTFFQNFHIPFFTRYEIPHQCEEEACENFKKYFEVAGELLPLLNDVDPSISKQRCEILSCILDAFKFDIKLKTEVIDSPLAIEQPFDTETAEPRPHASNKNEDSDDYFETISLCSVNSDTGLKNFDDLLLNELPQEDVLENSESE